MILDATEWSNYYYITTILHNLKTNNALLFASDSSLCTFFNIEKNIYFFVISQFPGISVFCAILYQFLLAVPLISSA